MRTRFQVSRREAIFGALAATLAGPAAASRLKLKGGKAGAGGGGGGGGSTLPASQTVSFGAKTRTGYGGHALAYTGAGYLGITAGNTGSIWTIDANKHLVAAGTYAAAPPTYSGPYTLTVTEYSDAGKTTPTGVTSTVTVNILANAAHVRWGASDSIYDFQLGNVIDTYAQSIALGDTIYLRDGVYNPSELDCRIAGGTAAFSGSWSGSNYVTIRAENYRAATWKRLGISNSPSLTPCYLKLKDIAFNRKNTAALDPESLACLFIYQSSYWWVDTCGFVSDPDAAVNACDYLLSAIITGTANGNFKVTDNDFSDVWNGLMVYGDTGTIQGNNLRRIWNDGVQCGLHSNYLIADNFATDKRYSGPVGHGDFIQFKPEGIAAGTYLGHKIYRNLLSRGYGTPGYNDGQGVFFEGSSGRLYTGVEVKGNIYVGTFTRAVSIGGGDDAAVMWNSLILDTTSGITVPGVPGNPGVLLQVGQGGRVEYNATNGGVTLESGTALTNTTGNVQVSGANNATAYADPLYGHNFADRAEFLAHFGPKAGGVLDKAVTGFAYHTGAGWYDDYTNRTSSWPL